MIIDMLFFHYIQFHYPLSQLNNHKVTLIYSLVPLHFECCTRVQ